MKKTVKFAALLLVIASIMLAACSSPSGGGETATISINLNSGSLPDKASVSIEQLRHAILLTGPTGKQTYSISGSGTVKAVVAPGIWRIDIEAFLGNDLYAKGSATAEVRVGQNVNVTVQMIVIMGGGTAIGGGGGGGGGRPPYRISLSRRGTFNFPPALVGYSTQTPEQITITNTGTQATGPLDISVGTSRFLLNTILIPDIAPGATDTFDIWPDTGFAWGTYTDTVTVSSATNGINASFGVQFEVTSGKPAYGISLSQTGNLPFTAQPAGYSPISAYTITITNTGDYDTGALTIALTGDSSSFTIDRTSIADILEFGNDTFTIKPNDSLSAGTYNATVTVSGGHGLSQSFTVSFTVQVEAVAPQINTQPTGGTYNNAVTQTGTVTVAATPLDGGSLSYQWYTTASGGTAIPGATSASYGWSQSPGTSVTYYVVVTNTITDNGDGGTKTATRQSNNATVTVNLPTYTVTFNSNGGSAVSNQFVTHGNYITVYTPTKAITVEGLYEGDRTNYALDGWYDSSSNLYTSTTGPITTDITLTAKYVEAISSDDSYPGIVQRSVVYITANTGTYTLLLNGNKSSAPTSRMTNPGSHLILRGISPSSITLSTSGSLFLVGDIYAGDASNLTIGSNIDLVGVINNTTKLVFVYQDSTLNLNGGTIRDNKGAPDPINGGGGVQVAGTFNMSSGSITGNIMYNDHGGGVKVSNGGIFNMTGGNISGNSVITDTVGSCGGGVAVFGSSTFNMSNGTIIGNSAPGDGHGGVHVIGDFYLNLPATDANITSNTSLIAPENVGGGGSVHNEDSPGLTSW